MATSACTENIAMFLPPRMIPDPKPARYTSKFSGSVGKETFEMGAARNRHATMGLPNGYARNRTDAFMRKRRNERQHTSEAKTEKWIKQKMKAAVPDRKEKPVMGLVSDKDYVTTNAVKAILSKPPKAAPPKRWTERKGYGKKPTFCIADAAVSQENASQDSTQEQGWTQLTDEERRDVLRHLKTKWARVNASYQKLPFNLDTPAKKRCKEAHEQLLTQIEKDILSLEASKIIVVSDQ